MTLEAWVNPAAAMSGWQTVLFKERAGSMSYALYAHDGAPDLTGFAAPAGYAHIVVDQGVRDVVPMTPGVWTHLATTYGAGVQRFYVNGVLVGTHPQSVPGAMAVGNGALRIGGNNSFTQEFFAGLIDEIRIYNRALTAAEVVSDMNTPVQ